MSVYLSRRQAATEKRAAVSTQGAPRGATTFHARGGHVSAAPISEGDDAPARAPGYDLSEGTLRIVSGLLEAVPDASVLTTDGGHIAYINQHAERLFGYRRDELVGRLVNVLMPGRYATAHDLHLLRYARAPDEGRRVTGRRSDGWEFPIAVHLGPLEVSEGSYILSSICDLSGRRDERAFGASERFARATFDALPEHICVLDERGTILSTNAAWTAFAADNGGDPSRTGVGANYLDVCATADGPEGESARDFADGIRAVTRGEREECMAEYACHAPSERRWFTARAMRFPGGGPIRVVVTHENVSELELVAQDLHATIAAADAARQQAEHAVRDVERRRQAAENLRDTLTGLNSARPLDEVLHGMVARARRLLYGRAAALYRAGVDSGAHELVVSVGPLPKHAANGGATRPAHAAPSPDPYRAVLVQPVDCTTGNYGTLAIYYREPRDFTAEEVMLARTFCDQVALAVENAGLKDRAKAAAVEDERGRLGRDLHDSVTQSLFTASMIADSLPRIWERKPEEGRRGLEEVRRLTRGAWAEIRSVLFELRPATLHEKQLGELTRQFATALSGRTDVHVEVTADERDPLPPDVHVALYRIIQEALNNIVKYADASRSTVHIRSDARRAVVRVSDDGHGFDAATPAEGRLGLRIMHERADGIGARLSIVSRPGRGTSVAVAWEASGTELTYARVQQHSPHGRGRS